MLTVVEKYLLYSCTHGIAALACGNRWNFFCVKKLLLLCTCCINYNLSYNSEFSWSKAARPLPFKNIVLCIYLFKQLHIPSNDTHSPAVTTTWYYYCTARRASIIAWMHLALLSTASFKCNLR